MSTTEAAWKLCVALVVYVIVPPFAAVQTALLTCANLPGFNTLAPGGTVSAAVMLTVPAEDENRYVWFRFEKLLMSRFVGAPLLFGSTAVPPVIPSVEAALCTT